jgi:hypothetical protein
VFESYVFRDVTPIDGVAERVLAIGQRGTRHLHEAGKVEGIESSEALADMALSRGRSFAQLKAKLDVAG